MKKIVLFLFTICSFSLSAQETNNLFYPKYTLSQINETEITQFLKNYFHDLQNENIQLQLSFNKSSSASTHFEFNILYKQIPLLHTSIKFNTDIQGNIISIKKENFDLSLLTNFNPEFELNQWQKINIQDYANKYWVTDRLINSQYYKVHQIDNKPSIVLELNAWSKTNDNTLVLDIDGRKLFEYNHARHINIDTVVNVKIFKPDPLTVLSKNYGGIYVDNNDVNDTWINSAYITTTTDATFDNSNNTFYLENEFAAIDEIESPVVIPVTSTIPSFSYNRDQSGFEDANALYHITNFHKYISSIGYNALMNLQLLVDTHGQLGADNSVFNRNGGNPNVIYGEGGVDDAEDADVIVHEYSHGVSWSANNNTFTNQDRMGLDEGLADYFATSYSRSINPYNWQNVFNWDGPIWGGRVANTNTNYPTGLGLYKIGEIWNCAMSAIWTDLGNIITDKLMLESLHFFTNNTTLPEAAIYVMQSDTILFGGIHSTTICNHFKNKNILDANCKPTRVSEPINKYQIQLVNTIGFAENIGVAKIILPQNESGKYSLYDLSGKLIQTYTFNNLKEVTVAPFNLSSGMYILNVQIKEQEKTFKLNKF